MQRAICELIKNEIIASNLSWLDVVCGMVEPMQATIRNDEGTITKTLPAYRKPKQTGCKIGNDYIGCIPDTNNQSVIYIEAGDNNVNASTSHYDEYTLPVKVVCWVNLNAINMGYDDASILSDELLSVIGSSLSSSAPYNTIRVEYKGMNRDVDAVNKYDYNEAENQMWIYPFDFFVIDLEIIYRRTRNCHLSSFENPSGCKTY